MLNIAAGAPASTGYNLTRSLRFRASASAYLNRTPAVSGNVNRWTWSGWVKRGDISVASRFLFSCGSNTSFYGSFAFASNKLEFGEFFSGSFAFGLSTNNLFRDPAAWYHIVLLFDSTQATSTNRLKLFVNGIEATYSSYTAPSLNQNSQTNLAQPTLVGANFNGPSQFLDGYLAEVNFVDGQGLTAASFGSTNALTGVWQPARYTGTYGTNGFYLPFTDNSSATPAGLGKDFSGATTATIVCSTTSGSTTMTVATLTGVQVGSIVTGTGIPANTYVVSTGVLSVTLSQAATSTNAGLNYVFSGNNWTTNNISLTAGVTYDSMTDVPTLTNATTANYAVWNPLDVASTMTASNANLKLYGTSAISLGRASIALPSTGKFYYEMTMDLGADANNAVGYGVCLGSRGKNTGLNQVGDYMLYISNNAYLIQNGVSSGTIPFVPAVNSIIQVAVDVSAGKLWFGVNNLYYIAGGASTGNPSTGANPSVTGAFSGLLPLLYLDSTVTTGTQANFGQRPFAYTPPTGFVALNTFNLPTATILKGNTQMDATLYTGNGSTQTITNAAGFRPDLVWAKSRSASTNHILVDSVRGSSLYLNSNTQNGNVTDATVVSAFNSNGFSVGSNSQTNANAATFVGWQWKANGAAVSNTAGTITSQVSANPSAGFSVATYTGTGTTATIGHGLGVAPSFVLVKSLTGTTKSWIAYHKSLGADKYFFFNTADAAVTSTSAWNNASPTSSVFSVTFFNQNNESATPNVAYCWVEIDGFSKFGSYKGNGSTDGTMVYTGFRPKFVFIRRTDAGGSNSAIVDSTRNPANISNFALFPTGSSAEFSIFYNIDLLSNGFKLRDTDANINANGGDYIYMAFAENPFKNSLAR